MENNRTLSSKTDAEAIKAQALTSLDDDKAEEIVVIDLEGKADFAYYMVVCSGRSTRHVKSLAQNLLLQLKEIGLIGLNVEGLDEAQWVLIDALDVVFHIMTPEMRTHYSLEALWGMKLPMQS
jgi:ribosome-associated protein